jgi:hypothetical protein
MQLGWTVSSSCLLLDARAEQARLESKKRIQHRSSDVGGREFGGLGWA